MKKRKIEERIAKIEESLANAAAYLAKNVNVEGCPYLHLDDWRGKSGHPLWMKNFMVPVLKKSRSKQERTLDRIEIAEKGKNLTRRKKRAKGEE